MVALEPVHSPQPPFGGGNVILDSDEEDARQIKGKDARKLQDSFNRHAELVLDEVGDVESKLP